VLDRDPASQQNGAQRVYCGQAKRPPIISATAELCANTVAQKVTTQGIAMIAVGPSGRIM